MYFYKSKLVCTGTTLKSLICFNKRWLIIKFERSKQCYANFERDQGSGGAAYEGI